MGLRQFLGNVFSAVLTSSVVLKSWIQPDQRRDCAGRGPRHKHHADEAGVSVYLCFTDRLLPRCSHIRLFYSLGFNQISDLSALAATLVTNTVLIKLE